MSTAIDIFDAVSHRLPVDNATYAALNMAIRTINKRLFFYKSSMVNGELSVSVTADNDGTLPSDFWGLNGYPYINGKTWRLKPLPDLDTKLTYSDSGISKYYQIFGQTLRLVPTTSSDLTINGDYWQRPTKITAPSDTMPYFEMFDDAIAEYLIHWYALGSKGSGEQIGALAAFINNAVDDVVPYIEQTAAPDVVQVVDWDGLAYE